MKTLTVITFLGALAVLPMAHAQKGTLVFPTPPATNAPLEPPPVYHSAPAPVMELPPPQSAPSQPAPPSHEVYTYEQKPIQMNTEALVAPEQAQAIIDRFKIAYAKLGNPRLLIYVNRELVTEHSGLKLTG